MKRQLTEIQKAIAKARRTALEDQFLASIRALGVPEPHREVRFSQRRWRFDFAWPYFCLPDRPLCRLAVEIEGGIWIQGRHQRGGGFEEDCRKYNVASKCWHVLRFTGAMVKSMEAAQVTKEALGK